MIASSCPFYQVLLTWFFNHLFDQSLFSETIISFSFLLSCLNFEEHPGWGTNDGDCVEVWDN